MQRKRLAESWPSEGLKLQAYEKTPIYKAARDLLRDGHLLVARIEKTFKFTLGAQINQYTFNLAEAIFLAYEENEDEQKKLHLIKEIGNHTQKLLVAYRIAFDLNLIPRGNESQLGFAIQVGRIVHIIAQYRNWSQKLEASLKTQQR